MKPKLITAEQAAQLIGIAELAGAQRTFLTDRIEEVPRTIGIAEQGDRARIVIVLSLTATPRRPPRGEW